MHLSASEHGPNVVNRYERDPVLYERHRHVTCVERSDPTRPTACPSNSETTVRRVTPAETGWRSRTSPLGTGAHPRKGEPLDSAVRGRQGGNLGHVEVASRVDVHVVERAEISRCRAPLSKRVQDFQ